MKSVMNSVVSFCRRHWKFYLLLLLALGIFHVWMIKELCPFIHMSESTYVTADAAFLVENLRFFPIPHVEFTTDYFAFPYRMQPVFLTWMLEHDYFSGIMFKLFGAGPWEQLYWLMTLFLSAAVIYHLLRAFGGYGEWRSSIFSLVVTFCNYAVICKYPQHYTVVICHWMVVNLVMDFLTVKRYFEKDRFTASFILLRIFFLLMVLGVDLAYIAGLACSSFVLTVCFLFVWEAISKKSPLAPFVFIRQTLFSAFQKDFFRRKRNYLLIALILIPLLFFLPVVLQIAWITKHGEVSESALMQTGSLARALVPIFPHWNPVACSLAKGLDTIYANCTGWTFLFLALMGIAFGRRRTIWLIPFLSLYVLSLFIAQVPVLKCLPWCSYARYSERLSPVLVPCLMMAYLVLPADLFRKRLGGCCCLILSGLFVIECACAYKKTFLWIDSCPVTEQGAECRAMIEKIAKSDGSAIFTFPFCICGGDMNSVAGSILMSPISHAMQIASFAGKKTNCFYGGRLDCSSGDLQLAKDKNWDALFAEARTGAAREETLKTLIEFVERNDFCGILLCPLPNWVSPAFREQLYRHFGRPVASCKYTWLPLELLKVARRNDSGVYYGEPFTVASLTPTDVVEFPCESRFCFTRNFSESLWGCGRRYSLTFEPKTKADAYRIVISATPFLIPQKQDEKVIQIRGNGQVICTRRYVLGRPETMTDLSFDLPARALGAGGGQITLDFLCLSPQKSPAFYGREDHRELSMVFRKLTCEPAVNTRQFMCNSAGGATSVSDEYSVACDTELVRLGKGFAGMEPWGCWTDGETAQLEIVIPSRFREKDLRLTFDAYTFVTEGHPVCEFSFESAGERLADFKSREWERALQLDVPAKCVKQGVLPLTIRVKNSASHVELGKGSDSRRLGIGLKRVRFLPKDDLG